MIIFRGLETANQLVYTFLGVAFTLRMPILRTNLMSQECGVTNKFMEHNHV